MSAAGGCGLADVNARQVELVFTVYCAAGWPGARLMERPSRGVAIP